MADVINTMVVRIVGDIERFKRDIENAKKMTRNWAKKLDSQMKSVGRTIVDVGKSIADVGEKAKKTGKNLSKYLSIPIIGLSGLVLKLGEDFNAGLANIATLGIADNRLSELKENIKEISIETAKSLDDITGGLYQVISAFGDTADSAEILRINAKAGAAGLATTTDAINLTSAVTKGYGDTTKEAVQKASDLAFITVKLGQTNFPELASSIGRVVPLANELGVSQEELFTSFATLTGVTGSAAEVSTQYRGILQSLTAPTKSMKELFDRLGISSGKALLEQVGVAGALKLVVKEAKNTGKPLQDYISSIEGQTAATVLAGSQSGVYAEKLKEMQAATGATNEAFRRQTQGVAKSGFALKQLEKRLRVAAVEAGDILAPSLELLIDNIKPLAKWISELISEFSRLSDGTKIYIGLVLGLLAALGPLVVVIGQSVIVVGSLTAAFGYLTQAAAASGVALSAANLALISLQTAGVAVATVGIIGLAKAIYELTPAMREYTREVERSAGLHEKFLDRMKRTTNEILKQSSKLTGNKKKEFIDSQLEELEKTIQATENRKIQTEKSIKELSTTYNVLTGNKILADVKQEKIEINEELAQLYDRKTRLLRVLRLEKQTSNTKPKQKIASKEENLVKLQAKLKLNTGEEGTEKVVLSEKERIKKQILESMRLNKLRAEVERELGINKNIVQDKSGKKKSPEDIAKETKERIQNELNRPDNHVDLTIKANDPLDAVLANSAEAEKRIKEFALAQQERIGIERDRGGLSLKQIAEQGQKKTQQVKFANSTEKIFKDIAENTKATVDYFKNAILEIS